MKKQTTILIDVLIVLVNLVPFIYLFSQWSIIPDVIPTHWDINNKPNDWGSKYTLLIMPLIMGLPIYLLLKYLPKIDPKKLQVEAMLDTLLKLRVLIAFVMSAVSVFIIYATIHPNENIIGRGLFIILSIFFIIMGNFLMKVRPNYFVGIRTPWTISDERVWKKTHQLGGRLWFYGFILVFILGLIMPEPFGVLGLVAWALISTGITLVYSYKVFKQFQSAG